MTVPQRFESQYSDRWIVLERGTVVASGDRTDAHRLRAAASSA
jgi:hypothetical protein